MSAHDGGEEEESPAPALWGCPGLGAWASGRPPAPTGPGLRLPSGHGERGRPSQGSGLAEQVAPYSQFVNTQYVFQSHEVR